MPEIKRLTFRMPINLYAKIDKLAKIEHRSLNSEIILAIEEYCKAHLPECSEQKELKNE